jgi:hypothetical protein
MTVAATQASLDRLILGRRMLAAGLPAAVSDAREARGVEQARTLKSGLSQSYLYADLHADGFGLLWCFRALPKQCLAVRVTSTQEFLVFADGWSVSHAGSFANVKPRGRSISQFIACGTIFTSLWHKNAQEAGLYSPSPPALLVIFSARPYTSPTLCLFGADPIR